MVVVEDGRGGGQWYVRDGYVGVVMVVLAWVPLVVVGQGPIHGSRRVVHCSDGMVVDMVVVVEEVEVGESCGGQHCVGG